MFQFFQQINKKVSKTQSKCSYKMQKTILFIVFCYVSFCFCKVRFVCHQEHQELVESHGLNWLSKRNYLKCNQTNILAVCHESLSFDLVCILFVKTIPSTKFNIFLLLQVSTARFPSRRALCHGPRRFHWSSL